MRIQTDKNDQQWAAMNSLLNSNGNNQTDHSVGFQVGKDGQPSKNPYEMDFGDKKEDLTWLIK